MTVSTADFGSISSFADLTPFFPISDETNFFEYLEQRGYRIDGNLRAAPYDWRLGSSMWIFAACYSILRWGNFHWGLLWKITNQFFTSNESTAKHFKDFGHWNIKCSPHTPCMYCIAGNFVWCYFSYFPYARLAYKSKILTIEIFAWTLTSPHAARIESLCSLPRDLWSLSFDWNRS